MAAFARSSLDERTVMAVPAFSRSVSVSLKSKRWPISLSAWFSALSTSFHCTLETTSKLGMGR